MRVANTTNSEGFFLPSGTDGVKMYIPYTLLSLRTDKTKDEHSPSKPFGGCVGARKWNVYK